MPQNSETPSKSSAEILAGLLSGNRLRARSDIVAAGVHPQTLARAVEAGSAVLYARGIYMEAEHNRAAILEVDRASGRWRIFASGLRNPNGLSFEPQTGVLWTVVNERDELGPDLVPDYMEDNLYMSKGVLAKTNAELVAHAAGILKSLGASVATAQDARAMLGLA